jgi:CDP-diacylglycerol--serine O-phosphatidyltransferase
MPRPAGRRWDRLRRSGSRASQVIAQVTRVRRPHDRRSADAAHAGTQLVYPQSDRSWRRLRGRRPSGGGIEALERPSSLPSWAAAPAPVEPQMLTRVAEPATATPTTIPLLPGERTPVRRLKFAVANGCTVASLLLGMTAVFLALGHDFRLAALALLACVAFDGCDGGLARKFGVASPFGAQMDSMADLSSFGVATGIVMFEWLVADGTSRPLAGLACALIAVCAAIRLARFNVSPKDGRFFCGVPTTMVAAVLALDVLIGPHLPPNAQVLAIMVYALAMVTSFPYAKLVRFVRLPLWVWVLPAICAMISVPGTYAVIVGGYLLSGPALWLFHSRRRLLPAA